MADLRVAERVRTRPQKFCKKLKRAATKKIVKTFLLITKFRKFWPKIRQCENNAAAISDLACPTNVRHLQNMFSDLLADKIVHLARPLADLSNLLFSCFFRKTRKSVNFHENEILIKLHTCAAMWRDQQRSSEKFKLV